jgi:hypothetical protein
MPGSVMRSSRPRAIPAPRDNAPPHHIFGEAGLRDGTDGIPLLKHGIPALTMAALTSDQRRKNPGTAI